MPANEYLAPAALPLSSLAEFYASESTNLKQAFEASGDGVAFIRARAGLVDQVIARLYGSLLSARLEEPSNFCLLAVGGFGRQELFPFSDVDLLFLAYDGPTLHLYREAVAAITKNLWDLRLRVGHSARTLPDCAQLHRDNLEFSVALLEVRYLAGDRLLFEALRSQAIPRLVARDQQDLVRNLIDLTQKRHAKYGKTIFHLEPDVKQAPGGLRDFHVAQWLALIPRLADRGSWDVPEDFWPPAVWEPARQSARFLSAVRCFLHFEHGRNDNLLTYEAQEKAAAASVGLVGLSDGKPADPAKWMRQYYLHVRSIYRLTSRQIEEATPSRASLYGLFQDWRSRLSNPDFSVIRGKVFPRSGPSRDIHPLLHLFEMMARHGLELSREAERWAEESLRLMMAGTGDAALSGRAAWPAFRRVLGLPHTADALRAMHRLGLLTALFPEFRAVDALVIRDYFHRYTVDEHSFVAIQNLCELSAGQKGASAPMEEAGTWEQKFAGLFSEIERPDLLCFALLFHDVGKGMDASGHIEGSLRALKQICARLELVLEETEMIFFLVAHHLEMSATMMRRDIFDPETIRSFAEKVGATERLKMLCLFTYADIKAVNPEALTPWKAEMLWQLYAMTFNYLSRSLDEDRLPPSGETIVQAACISPRAGRGAGSGEMPMQDFLAGFPKRYLATHTPREIAEHAQWAREIQKTPLRVRVRREPHLSELTVLTTDRPFLFASITGTLAGWGMNILKADAFANRSGIVIDTFRFHDLFRTLELNPSEALRLEKNITEVLTGKTSVPELMAGRTGVEHPPRVKVKTPTQIRFDDSSSSRCSLMELIAQDRPGLLYRVSSTLAGLGCSIEVALIDTEAQKAIDVFYLTFQQAKLSPEMEQAISAALLAKLPAA